jgi:hypothetical protein
MKKIITFIICVMIMCVTVHAQNYIQMNVTEIENNQVFEYCESDCDSITISKDENCTETTHWIVASYGVVIFDGYVDQVTIGPYLGDWITIEYFNCTGAYKVFHFYFLNFNDVEEPWVNDYIWKRPGESITLEAYWEYVNNEWSTGSTGYEITVTEPGFYWVHMYNQCGELWDTIQVRNNVEIVSASVDPSTNKNLVTWDVTLEQATYISNVIVNRDGVDMATVPYSDGQFLDNIGSDLAARIYTIVGVCPDGTLCPIQSLSRGTIHMAFLPDINGNVEMTWNQPELGGADIHVGRFEICEYDPDSNEINVIDFVSSVTTSYSCNQSMFDYGYPLIRAIIQDGRGERDMLSNRTDEIVGLNETVTDKLRVYPNPSNGVFNIEGAGTLHIVNVLGQEIMAKEIDGIETVELPKGMYFVQLNGVVRKIVVE